MITAPSSTKRSTASLYKRKPITAIIGSLKKSKGTTTVACAIANALAMQ